MTLNGPLRALQQRRECGSLSVMTLPTVAIRILEELRRSAAALDDDELAQRLSVRPRQTINQACRALAHAGRIRRYPGPAGKLVNDLQIAPFKEDPPATPRVETLAEVPAGDSSTQRKAEAVMLRLLGKRLGVSLAPRRFEFPQGFRVEIDGADHLTTVLVEVWAHQGAPKSAQKHKVLADALRLLFVASTLPTTPRLILCLSDPAAAHHFTSARSWAAAALQNFGVDVEVVNLPDDLRAEIAAAQTRQYR